MKLSVNWLKQYVDLDWSPSELAERLMMAGIEVEAVQRYGPGYEGIVTARILSVEKHPNADRLTVCRVSDGRGERQIVCGAKNHKAGDVVPLALPGCTLPAPGPDGRPLTIQEAKLRGVVSQGMMCSPRELGLAEESQGLLILPPETPVGVGLAEVLGGGDTILDLEITPNRPDWLSVIGIAREVAALSGKTLRLPTVELATAEEAVGVTVRVEAPELCPRYTARVTRGVKIGPSPRWMREALEKAGLRAINNVVDVTNYVLLECGQPLHAFDLRLLAGREVVVRRARAGETIRTLDGKDRSLTEHMLVIADAEKPVALAGIMGGADSEIHNDTEEVLLESACFHPPSIRATAKKVGLRSESSYRFERGVDIGLCDWASRRAAALLVELAGGRVSGEVIDLRAPAPPPRRVPIRFERLNHLLGVTVEPSRVQNILQALGLELVESDPRQTVWVIPTHRPDLEQEADLIEEVCRIHGVNRIPSVVRGAAPGESPADATYDFHQRLRQAATALGFDEAINYSLLRPDAQSDEGCRVANPLSEDYSALRTSLLPGLLAAAAHNVGHKQTDLRLFELGRVFTADGSERTALGFLLTGRRAPRFWEGGEPPPCDIHDLKGVVEELLAHLHLSGWTGETEGATFRFRLGAEVLGELREVDAARTARLKIHAPVFYAELDVARLERAVPRALRYQPLPQFPAVGRDIALVVAESRSHQEILEAIRRSHEEVSREGWLEKIEPFDLFRGGSIPPGKKSMAYSLIYRSAQRTLTDAEVNALHEKVKAGLKAKLGCEIRE